MASSALQRRIDHGDHKILPAATEPERVVGQAGESNVSSPRDYGSQIVDQLAAAWEEGKCKSVEQFLADRPEAGADPEIAVRLVYEEFCLRQEAGEKVDPVEFLRRFPQWRSELEIVLDCHQFVQSAQETPEFPVAGEQLGEFRLLAELGRGAEGRVFLATQASLSNRPVVVKVVTSRGKEHLSLARLQHKSIVPLYWVQDQPSRKLRVLCMPYVGGVNSARLLEQLADVPIAQRSGQHLVAALEAARAAAPVALPMDSPALLFLSKASYVQAVCWIGACVADALRYAHARGLVHLDLKPSNILLAGDGQPMLLDFHLAQPMIRPGHVKLDWLGGTPGYMSPEQEAAMEAVRNGLPVPTAVDGRSDIYSLGVLLYELLTVVRPFGGRHEGADGGADRLRAWLSEAGGNIPRRVADIVGRCLARDTERRYGDAGRLASDLRHCLIDSPYDGDKRLRIGGARPARPIAVAVLLTAVSILGVMAFSYFVGTDPHRARQVAAREETMQQRLRCADELHSLVDRLRFLNDLESLPADRLRKLEMGCGLIWRNRGRWLKPADPLLDSQAADRVRRDLLDLAILWADLHVRLAATGKAEPARRESLQVLAQAEAELGSSVVLSRERQSHAEALGLADECRRVSQAAAQMEPRTAWEHYILGRSLLRAGHAAEAAELFQLAVDLEPQAFWPNFHRGVCAYRLRQFETALAAFSACVALAPDKAECYQNRGLAYRAVGREDLATRDLQTARRLGLLSDEQ